MGILVEGSEIFYKVFQAEVIVLLWHKNSSSQGRRGREGGREEGRERGRERDKEEEREEGRGRGGEKR